MKILLVGVGHQCDAPGGTPRIAHEEAEALRDLGHEVWMLAGGGEGRAEHEVRDGVNLLRYAPETFAVWDPRRATAHQRAASVVLRKYLPQVDAVHGHIQLAYLAALDVYGESVHSMYTIHSPVRPEMEVVWRGRGWMQRMFAPLALRRRVKGSVGRLTGLCCLRCGGSRRGWGWTG